MNGKIVAVNRNAGVIVVETDVQNCVVLKTAGVVYFAVGEEVEGDWNETDQIVIKNLSSGFELHAHVQQTNATRSEAVGSMIVI